MKEASGELNLTVVTIIAIAAVGLIASVFWPKIQESIEGQWNLVTQEDQQGGIKTGP